MRKKGGRTGTLFTVLIWTLAGCLIAALMMLAAASAVSSGSADEELLAMLPAAASFSAALLAALGAPGRRREAAFPAALTAGLLLILVKTAADMYCGGSIFDGGDIPVICAVLAGTALGAFMRGRRKRRPARPR